MAKKNTAHTVKDTCVNYCNMICWSIRYLEAERKELDNKMNSAKAANLFDIVDWCIEKMHEIDAAIDMLRLMYKIETGTEYC